MSQQTYKLKIFGVGGQGVKLLSRLVVTTFAQLGYKYTTELSAYDSAIKGGKVSAEIIASKVEIVSPFLDDCDMALVLGVPDHFINTKLCIFEKSVKLDIDQINALSEKLEKVDLLSVKNKGFDLNFLALGVLFNKLEVPLREMLEIDFGSRVDREEVLKCIKEGYLV